MYSVRFLFYGGFFYFYLLLPAGAAPQRSAVLPWKLGRRPAAVRNTNKMF
jgi:hypothetical protein